MLYLHSLSFFCNISKGALLSVRLFFVHLHTGIVISFFHEFFPFSSFALNGFLFTFAA